MSPEIIDNYRFKKKKKLEDIHTKSNEKLQVPIIPCRDSRRESFFQIKKRPRFIPVFKSPYKPELLSAISPYLLKSEENLKLNPHCSRLSNSKLEIQEISPTEMQVIDKTIKTTLQKEYRKARNRISKRIEKMNRIGIIPSEINEARGRSLLSLEEKSL